MAYSDPHWEPDLAGPVVLSPPPVPAPPAPPASRASWSHGTSTSAPPSDYSFPPAEAPLYPTSISLDNAVYTLSASFGYPTGSDQPHFPAPMRGAGQDEGAYLSSTQLAQQLQQLQSQDAAYTAPRSAPYQHPSSLAISTGSAGHSSSYAASYLSQAVAGQTQLPSPTTPSFQSTAPYSFSEASISLPPGGRPPQAPYYDSNVDTGLAVGAAPQSRPLPRAASYDTSLSGQSPPLHHRSSQRSFEWAYDPSLEPYATYASSPSLPPTAYSSFASSPLNPLPPHATLNPNTAAPYSSPQPSPPSHSPYGGSSYFPPSAPPSLNRRPPRSASYPHLAYATQIPTAAPGTTTSSSASSSTFSSPSYHGGLALPVFPSTLDPPSPTRPHNRAQSYSDVRGLGAAAGNKLSFVSRRGSNDSLWSEDSANGTTRTPAEWEVGLQGLSLAREAEEDSGAGMEVDLEPSAVGVVLNAGGGEALEESVKRYIDSPNRLIAGERTVLVLNPRVVQRSYGTEKRFLCPQPMALLLGASWWSNVEASGPKPTPKSPTSPLPSAVPVGRVNEPPEVYITMSTDASTSKPEPVSVEWMDSDGTKVVENQQESDDQTILAGRANGKSNYISTAAAVHALVTIVAPGTKPQEERLIGTFPGKPMTVISKPSKRRQTSTSCMSLQHGGLVSLYNRTKSQTGSTRFLGVSGLTSSFPAMDWRAMTGGLVRSYAPSDAFATTFVARTGSWDAFVCYAVDLSLPTLDPHMLPAPAPYPGYPRPPVNAIPFDVDNPQSIYYNMPIVLQCLATAVVSPVMIIRKVEGKSSAIGGGSIDGYSPRYSRHLPCAPGERLGEAVAQFRPLALEVYGGPGKPENTFLACLGDAIGINQSREARVILPPVEIHSNQVTPVKSRPSTPPLPTMPLTPTSDSGGYFPTAPVPPTPQPPTTPAPGPEFDGQDAFFIEDHTANGAKVRKVRRLSGTGSIHTSPYPTSPSGAAPRPPGTLAKHKRRGVSLSSLTALTSEFSEVPAYDAPPRWSIECGDPCVWTIAAIDIARHTFFIPTDVTGGTHGSINAPPTTINPLYRTPVPAFPITAALPVVIDYDLPVAGTNRATGSPEDTMITLFGENFSKSCHAWLGSSPVAHQIVKSTQVMLISAPTAAQSSSKRSTSLRITLVRTDGVVFPSGIFYRDS